MWQDAETYASLCSAPDCLDGSYSTLGHLRVLVVQWWVPLLPVKGSLVMQSESDYNALLPFWLTSGFTCKYEDMYMVQNQEYTGSCPLLCQRLAPFITQGIRYQWLGILSCCQQTVSQHYMCACSVAVLSRLYFLSLEHKFALCLWDSGSSLPWLSFMKATSIERREIVSWWLESHMNL